ncbi:MAG: hypothetical protein HY819_03890 [Acidobacteria bacterium]|nr:hypothetical protein [Acidobacteriota bacterium]
MSFDNIASKFLYFGLETISNLQQSIGLEVHPVALSPQEIKLLEKIFYSSIDYKKVRVKAGNSHLLTISGRAFVMGNTIYMPRENYLTSLLIHEMVHIWQYQNQGYDYISKSLKGQYLGEGYDFVKGIEGAKPWVKLNPEQQASLIEEAYISGFFNETNREFFYKGKNYTLYLKDALAILRNNKKIT